MITKQLRARVLPALGALFLLALWSCEHSILPDRIFLLEQPDGTVVLKGTVADMPSLPSNARKGWAYFVTSEGKSYVWNGSGWEPFAGGGVPPELQKALLWQGSHTAVNPQDPASGMPGIPAPYADNWAYYNEADDTIYIYSNPDWIAVSTNMSGAGIVWKGEQSGQVISGWTPPESGSAQNGWIYYNTTDKRTYLYEEVVYKV
jgi:hypothetical protein